MSIRCVSRLILVFIAGVLIIGSASIAAVKGGSLKIDRVALSAKSFEPSKGESVTLGFEVTRDASARVDIYDWLGRKVRSIAISEAKAGRNSIVWDGKTTKGEVAAGEVFLYVIEAETKDGDKAVHNPSKKTGGIEVEPHEFNLDWETGKIEYVLPKSCVVRIRAGFTEGMCGMSVIDWSPKTSGRHEYVWDGKDTSGKINLLKHKDLDIRLSCYTLPSNSIIVTGKTTPFKADSITSKKRNSLYGTAKKYKHYRHDPLHCHQPKFSLTFPTGKEIKETDAVEISGVTPIRVQLDPDDAMYLLNTRFEVVLYIDGMYIFETEEGSNPFTFSLDTKDLMKGPHVITVNILSYSDHIGIKSRKVIIGE